MFHRRVQTFPTTATCHDFGESIRFHAMTALACYYARPNARTSRRTTMANQFLEMERTERDRASRAGLS